MEVGTIPEQAQTAFWTAAQSLMYDDWELRDLTHSTIIQVEKAGRIDELDVLLLHGILKYAMGGDAYQYLRAVENLGGDHRLLYYFIGCCFKWGGKGVEKDVTKAIEYYTKSIGSTSCPCKLLLRLIKM